MLEKVGIKVKIKPVEATVLAEVIRKGDYQAYICSESSGPDPLGGAQVLPLRDSALGLQLHHVQERRGRQAPGRGRRHRRSGQADRDSEKGECHHPGGGADVVLQLQQGRHGVSALAQGLQPNATELAFQDYEEHLGRRIIAGREVGGRTRRRHLLDSSVTRGQPGARRT